MTTAEDIRSQTPSDVLDYQQLMSFLSGYAKPRDRVGRLLAQGGLVRVRKGLYVLGERSRRGPLNRELLANLIYGPSYVSLDSALSYHGMIPERVENVLSATTRRTRRFVTPFGVFAYRSFPCARYAPGVQWMGEGAARYLVASPEKALIDKIWADMRFKPANRREVEAYLMEDLRMDRMRLAALDMDRLVRIAGAFGSKKVDLLVRVLIRLKGAAHE